MGETTVPVNDNEHDDNELDIREVIELFHLDAAALKAGREACRDQHNAKRALHVNTPEMKVSVISGRYLMKLYFSSTKI